MMFAEPTDIEVGQFITFLYIGGSNPNTIRRVYVHKVDRHKRYIGGFDIDPHSALDEPLKHQHHSCCEHPTGMRNFKFEKMANILCAELNEDMKVKFQNYVASNFIYDKMKSKNISIDTINTILNLYNNSIVHDEHK